MTQQIPIDISGTDALNSIGENIIIADKDYTITWMNKKAIKSLSAIAPLYGLPSADHMIGLKMDYFHVKPDYQRHLMAELQEGHRARINIRNTFDADIVITPIRGNEDPKEVTGYMVMLMDVTTQAEEEKKKERLIRDLSVPILRIWEKTIVLPLVGELDLKRGETVISTVLEKCVSDGIDFAMISLSGINSFDYSVRQNLQNLYDCLKLIGVECIIVGIKPELALNIGELSNIQTFSDANSGLKHIIRIQDEEF
ncbi:STAS domain-containing protein [Virgibacillus sp. DJP39]|uniref:STAS domain-containing protein n=1 Tax=Virgibacillus sp. DJP39 TaxID=3409790 RepID=UPI003BB7A80B